MTHTTCRLCNLPTHTRDLVDSTLMVGSSSAALRSAEAAGVVTSTRSLRRHRSHITTAPVQDPVEGAGSSCDSPVGDGWAPAPVGGDDDLYETFDRDPVVWELTRVGYSQLTGPDGVERTWVKPTFALRAPEEAHVADLSSAANTWRSALITTHARSEEPDAESVGTYTLLVADPQLGKKGTAEAVENWRRGVRGHCARIRQLRSCGRSPAAVHVGFQGDETEGVCNNYRNQPHTIELPQDMQLELDYDLRVWTLRELLSLGLPVSASSVISNHGEWTRNGAKDPVTTRNDNSSTHIARQVRKLFAELAPFTGQRVEWTIGDNHPGVVVELSGERCYFTHGYVEKGRGGSSEIRVRSALERQVLADVRRLGDVRLWFVAHYHHFYAQEWEGRTTFGCPALEARQSSEYMRDQFGVWSEPGMLGVLVGADTVRGWSEASVL